MRKTTDEEFSEMSKEKLILRLSQVNAEFHEAEDTNVLRLKFKALSRTRHLKIWHDLSTVANHSHIVFMISCLYDSAVFYTNEEYEVKM